MTIMKAALDMMANRAMAEKLREGSAVDISAFGREGHHYLLDAYADGIDYCDMNREAWVYSIGRRRKDGKIIASTNPNSDLYQNPEYDCLWLR